MHLNSNKQAIVVQSVYKVKAKAAACAAAGGGMFEGRKVWDILGELPRRSIEISQWQLCAISCL